MLCLFDRLIKDNMPMRFARWNCSDSPAGRHQYTRYGIREESATGMAAGPLACFLHDKMKIAKEDFLIEQGHLMNPASPSLITVKLHFTEQKISKLMAGGEAKVMESLTVSI